MFYFNNCWINKFYSTILIFFFSIQKNDVIFFNSVFNLFLNIACIMNGVTKKTKTHKAKSAESILLQQNHRSKNIIMSKNNKTKQTKQLHITWNNFFEIHHFSKGEIILHYFSYNERCLWRIKIESPLDLVINELYCIISQAIASGKMQRK